ncbi:MAG: LamG domain-containing protein, partial [Candidatus Heimdallarchaeota archaeon]
TQVGETWVVVNGGTKDSGWLNDSYHTFENIPKGYTYHVLIFYNDGWGTNWYQHIYIKNIYLGNVEPVRVPSAIHEYLFNTGEGNTAYDNVGSLDGTIHGPDWNSSSYNDDMGYCLDFEKDDYSDEVYHADDDDFSFGGDAFSVSIWACPETHYSTRGLMTKWNKYGNREWRFTCSGAYIYLELSNPTESAWIRGKADYSMSTGTWYHLTATYDGSESNSGITIYINGINETDVRDGSGTFTGMTNGNAMFCIGNEDNYNYRDFDGRLDNARIYDEELSASEVLLLYDIDTLN